MKVKMQAPTYWDSRRLKPGDTADVDEVTAARRETAGIAKPGEAKKPGDKSLEKMNTEELTQKAAVLGVDISAATTNKQRAEIIQAFVDGAGGDEPDDVTGEE